MLVVVQYHEISLECDSYIKQWVGRNGPRAYEETLEGKQDKLALDYRKSYQMTTF